MSRKDSIERILSSRPEIVPAAFARRDLEKKGRAKLRQIAEDPNKRIEYWMGIELNNGFDHIKKAPTPPPAPAKQAPQIKIRAESWLSVVNGIQKMTDHATAA